YCIQNNKSLSDLSMDEYQDLSPIFKEDIYEAISLETCVNKRQVIGGPAKEQIEKVIEINANYLKLQ
ncbi:MAG: argininosuccinate lyase, partial [Vallitaleaceae bacterium]|nr:argininosuccinate lyase [Vallitaleaceae bacterium]